MVSSMTGGTSVEWTSTDGSVTLRRDSNSVLTVLRPEGWVAIIGLKKAEISNLIDRIVDSEGTVQSTCPFLQELTERAKPWVPSF